MPDSYGTRIVNRIKKGIPFFAFSIVFALLPFAFVGMQMQIDVDHWSLASLAGNGQLYIVGVGISAAAIGELASSDLRTKLNRQLSLFACIGFLFLTGASYGGSRDTKEIIASAEKIVQSSSKPAREKTLSDYQKEEQANLLAKQEDEGRKERTADNSLLLLILCIFFASIAASVAED